VPGTHFLRLVATTTAYIVGNTNTQLSCQSVVDHCTNPGSLSALAEIKVQQHDNRAMFKMRGWLKQRCGTVLVDIE